MTAHQAEYPIRMMSRTLGVSHSGFYAHHRRPPSSRTVADEALSKRISEIHEASKETYGAPSTVIHHSDQGSRYTSVAFGLRCKEMGVRPSMGSVGDCYNNAPLGRLLRNRLPGSACARASLLPSNASCWIAASSRPRPRPASPASKAGTPPLAVIRLWGISHRSTMKGPPLKGWNLKARNRPSNRGNCELVNALEQDKAPGKAGKIGNDGYRFKASSEAAKKTTKENATLTKA